jgi:hypothetical protein
MARLLVPPRTIPTLLTATLVLTCLLVIGRPLYMSLKACNSKWAYDRRLLRTVKAGRMAVAEAGERKIREKSSKDLKRIVRTLHYGVPAKYTSQGRYIKGVSPQPIQAARVYEILVRRRCFEVYPDYAKLLEFGAPGHEKLVDHDKALRLYRMYYRTLDDLYDRYETLADIERLSPAHERALVSFERTKVSRQLNRRAFRKQIPSTLPGAPPGVRSAPLNAVRTTGEDIWVLPGDGVRAHDAENAIRNDAHNAHDSGVTKTTRASVERLKKAVLQQEGDDANALKDVRRLIFSADVPVDKKERAIQALDAVERNNQMMGSAGVTEVELMGLVWNRIHHEDNKDNAKVLRENLIDELSEMVEHDKTVCATGRFTHVLGTLDGVDKNVQIKPKWAIQRELIDRASVIYKEQVEALPELDKLAVNEPEPTPSQQDTYERVMGTIKEKIRNDFSESYVANGIMTPQDLDVEVSRFIDHIG